MKNLLSLFLVFAFPICVLSQHHYLGMKSGINWNNIASTDFIDDSELRTGISSGISYEYFFNDKISLGADLLYNQRGFSSTLTLRDAEGNAIGTGSTTNFNYDYLSIPIKAGYSIGNKFFGFSNIGVIPSILVSAKTTSPSLSGNGTDSSDVTDKVTKGDLAGFLEIGGGLKHRRYRFSSSLTYQNSFTTITNANYFNGSKITHYGLTLSLGIQYSLGKQ